MLAFIYDVLLHFANYSNVPLSLLSIMFKNSPLFRKFPLCCLKKYFQGNRRALGFKSLSKFYSLFGKKRL